MTFRNIEVSQTELDACNDFDDRPDDPCDHEDYEADILTGRAVCQSCGEVWYQTSAQIRAEHERVIAYDLQCEEWNREQVSLFRRLRTRLLLIFRTIRDGRKNQHPRSWG